MTGFIPVNEPVLDGNERAYLDACITSGWISSEGEFVTRFEAAFAEHLGRKHCISVTNGSDALSAAVWALDLPRGSEVILPSFTIISCASALLDHGLVPVVVDCEPDTWNMRAEAVRARITPNTSAIMAVHIYGLSVDMEAIEALAREHGLRVIEDSAEAIGGKSGDRHCGACGDVSAFSFYANKHVTTGEGGMIATDDDALAERCRRYRNLCFEDPRFVHHEIGRNMRMTNLQAAVGLAQIERLDEFMGRKRAMGARYQSLLADVPGIALPPDRTPHCENIYWVFAVVLDDALGLDARTVMDELGRRGIGTRPFFWPLHEQPVLRNMGLFADERHPVSERIARKGLYLPSGLAITEEQIDRSAATLAATLADLAPSR